MCEGQLDKLNSFRQFLNGGCQSRNFVSLDPSSYASIFAGKGGGHPSIEDQIKFHQAFPNDSMINVLADYVGMAPDLKWDRQLIKRNPDETALWEETLVLPSGTKRRVIGEQPGTTDWLVEPAIRSAEDFDLIDYYADCILESADLIAESISEYPALIRNLGMIPGAAILSAFEAYWLIDYPDMALFFMDCPDRYLASIKKIHASNMALLDALVRVGIEIVFTGSAGLELLSPRIFAEAIVPFQREFNDQARTLGCHSSYHICGHSRQLIESKVIDQIKPTIFETCSAPPCGNNESLHHAVNGISGEVITKGNLALELLRNGRPEEISEAVARIARDTEGRRHIIGQADGTILSGTPQENIRAFLTAVESLNN